MRGARVPAATLAAAAALAAAGCVKTTYHPLEERVISFTLQVDQITPSKPPAETGEDSLHLLPIPVGQTRFHVKVQAVGPRGELFTDFNRPVSFAVIPGDVVDVLDEAGHTTGTRMLQTSGGVATGWVLAQKVFGDVFVRVSDADPEPVYGSPDPNDLPDPPTSAPDAGAADAATSPVDDGARTYASGVSATIYFRSPLLADLQRSVVDASCKIDNKLSPFTGNFLTVEGPEGVADMIVTAITPDGFFVTDKNAQRLPIACYAGTLGSFGHMYVYNYNYPEGLSVGDHLVSLTGTVQEFSGHTQMTFPSWVRLRGDPRPGEVPAPLVFDFSNSSSTPPSVGYRICKTATGYSPKPMSMDTLCAYSNNNIDVESLESSLVKIVQVKPSNTFQNCDSNGNGNVPPFAWVVPELPGGGPDYDNAKWGCYDSDNDPSTPDPDMPDCQCAADCVTGTGTHATDAANGIICSEANTLAGYNQWIVQLEDKYKLRLAIQIHDALPNFNPEDFDREKHPEYQGCTLDVTGILKQVQAARPRWLVLARDERDVCCRPPSGGSCPPNIPTCSN